MHCSHSKVVSVLKTERQHFVSRFFFNFKCNMLEDKIQTIENVLLTVCLLMRSLRCFSFLSFLFQAAPLFSFSLLHIADVNKACALLRYCAHLFIWSVCIIVR